VTGCPREVPARRRLLLDNSGRRAHLSFAYAVAWTQHTYGRRSSAAAALLQLLLGNFGRPGAGIMALRGHASIQGSTDIPTLYHSIHGYMSHPRRSSRTRRWPSGSSRRRSPRLLGQHAEVHGLVPQVDVRRRGDAENDFGYDWHPKILGDHSHMPMFVAMNEGRVKGMLCIGQNPATSLNARLERSGLRKLEWLVVKDNWLHETAMFWKTAPEVRAGEVATADIETEVFFFPSAQVAEYDGSFTNTQRLLQWHYKAAEPPGDCRTDMVHLPARQAAEGAVRRQHAAARRGLQAPGLGLRARRPAPSSARRAERREDPEGDQRLLQRRPARHLAGFADLGRRLDHLRLVDLLRRLPVADRKPRRQPEADPPGRARRAPRLGLRLAGEPPHPVQPRLRRPAGPAVERAQEVGLVGPGGKWVGYDVPDFGATKPPTAPAQPGATGIDAHSGTDAFIMKADGVGWLYVPQGLVDGPLPTHYEPAESVVRTRCTAAVEPGAQVLARDGNPLAERRRPALPARHHDLPADRALPVGRDEPLAAVAHELQPELFVELSPELAREKGIATSTACASRARAAVRMPRRWSRGACGRCRSPARRCTRSACRGTGATRACPPATWSTTLSALVGDPNVSIHEGKAFVCNVEKA
jgi:formate dehydrogenase major subunit